MKRQSEFDFDSDESQIWESIDLAWQQQLIALLGELCVQYFITRSKADRGSGKSAEPSRSESNESSLD